MAVGIVSEKANDVCPALARQLAKLGEPVGKGLILPPRDATASWLAGLQPPLKAS